MAAGDAQVLAKYRDALFTQPRPQPVKLCKFCKKQIPLGALVCKFCSRDVNTADEAGRLTRTHLEEVVAQEDDTFRSGFTVSLNPPPLRPTPTPSYPVKAVLEEGKYEQDMVSRRSCRRARLRRASRTRPRPNGRRSGGC
jgi:hypothetical protein